VWEMYPHVKTREVAELLDRTSLSVYQAANKLGLRKTAEFQQQLLVEEGERLRIVGVRSRFRKGHPPPNKGLRRPGWGPGRMKETQFKKGQCAHNWRPIGNRRLVDGYLYTKVSDQRCVPWTRNWKPTHVLLWEKHRGPVPAGHAVVFVNRDRMDIRLGNLELISRAELMRRNTIHNLPPQLKGAIHVLGQLNRRIREKQNRRSA
jgi:hypothetical protein